MCKKVQNCDGNAHFHANVTFCLFYKETYQTYC